jgi:predicted cupin superfamily sugar epimerase
VTITAERIIELLGLAPLEPEGGYFAETYRASGSVSTAIYYLLTPETCSLLHRLPGDEVYHHYLGDPVAMLLIDPAGVGRPVRLGPDLESGMRPQVLVPGGTWQGSRLEPGGRFALMGTTMAPGFDFADYEAGDREALVAACPRHADTIRALTP